jgi:hypothetical protein
MRVTWVFIWIAVIKMCLAQDLHISKERVRYQKMIILREAMLKLASSHKLTSAAGATIPYDVSIVEASVDSTCSLRWKTKIALGLGSQTYTSTLNVRDVFDLKIVSSLEINMNVEPSLQILQVKIKAGSNTMQSIERFNADGSQYGVADVRHPTLFPIFVNTVSEGVLISQELRSAAKECANIESDE